MRLSPARLVSVAAARIRRPVPAARSVIPARKSLIAASVVAVLAASAVGFWLSYAGLHAFAWRAGLRGPEAWAWPASVDLFILAGELGVTISAVKGRHDKIAWAYLTAAALLSVTFNVLHVQADPVWWGRYAVAAVPPAAAILALAALMRQVFRGLTAVPATIGGTVPTDAGNAAAIALRATIAAGNPLSQNQLQERFGLSRPAARELRARLLPQTPAGTDLPSPRHQTVPAGPELNGSHG
jgi:Protein of unknown function (DUF2637)